MNLSSLKCVQKLSGTFKKINFKAYQARPEILLGVGLSSVVVATIVACIKTKDTEPVIDNCKEKIEELDFIKNSPMAEEPPTFKEYLRVYGKAAVDICKIYAIPAAVMTGGFLCIIGSHADMRHRNARLLADLTLTQTLFKEYRERVKNAIGEENEQKIYMGAKPGEILVDQIDESTGELVKAKKDGMIFVNQPGSIYARNYTEETSNEYDCRTYADYFLEQKIKHLDWELGTVPFMTLNEVYDALGFKHKPINEGGRIVKYGKIPDGNVVGWTRFPKVERGDRHIVVTKMVGYEPRYDEVTGEIRDYIECLRLDFNCYPLEGLI